MWTGFAMGGVSVMFARRGHDLTWRMVAAGANVLWMASDVMNRDWFGVAISAACIAFLLGRDFWKRGKRAARQLGEKSRAVVAGLVERMRESAPVPQGARA
jgi:hypothetical protein